MAPMTPALFSRTVVPTALFALSMAVLHGCDTTEPVAPEESPLPQAAAVLEPLFESGSANPPRPFKTRISGTMHILGLCADGAGVVAALNGAGNATHLGHVTMSSTICSLGPASVHGDFKVTMTAANGDGIFLLLTSTTFSPEGWEINVYDVTGGTGRFVDADGEIEQRVRLVTQPQPPEPGMWISTGEGWISY